MSTYADTPHTDVVRKGKIITTGGQVDSITLALCASLNDSDSRAQASAFSALVEVAATHPLLVLSTAHAHVVRHSKQLVRQHRVELLRVIGRVLDEHLDAVPADVAAVLVEFAAIELTATSEFIHEWQGAAAVILTLLGSKWTAVVARELLARFKPGVVPHDHLIDTLGELAERNAEAIVPQVKNILLRLTPILGSLSKAGRERSRAATARCVAHMAEAIESVAVAAVDPSARREEFAAEIFMAYEVMSSSSWAGDAKDVAALPVLAALGRISIVFHRTQFDGQAIRLATMCIPAFKTASSPGKGVSAALRAKYISHVIEAVASLLGGAVKHSTPVLEQVAPQLMAAMLPLLADSAEPTEPTAMRNHNELLRCFEQLARLHTPVTVQYLVQRVESRDVALRCAGLDALRHIITRLDKELIPLKMSIMHAVSPLAAPGQSMRTCKAVAQITIAMADKNYLVLEGGHALINHVMRLAATDPSKVPHDSGDIRPQEVRSVCESILHLIATTIPDMHGSLWPYILTRLIPLEYHSALGVMCRIAAHLAMHPPGDRPAPARVDFTDQALPRPVHLLAHLLLISATRPPSRTDRTAGYAVALLDVMAPLLVSPEPLQAELSRLMRQLQDASKDGKSPDIAAWESLVLDVFRDLVRKSPSFAQAVTRAVLAQLDLYEHGNLEAARKIAFKACAAVMQVSSGDAGFVRSTLDAMFAKLGLAVSVGMTARCHLDVVMAKLQQCFDTDATAKSGGLFSFVRDKSSKDIDAVKATLYLCLGYVAGFAPIDAVASAVEPALTGYLLQDWMACTTRSVQRQVVKAISMLGTALAPRRLQRQYVWPQRNLCVKVLLRFLLLPELRKGQMDLPFAAAALDALAVVLALPPALPLAKCKRVLDSICHVMAIPVPHVERADDVSALQQDMQVVTKSLAGVLSVLIDMEPGLTSLQWLTAQLLVQLDDSDPAVRQRSARALAATLTRWLSDHRDRFARELVFAGIGAQIGRLAPRLGDTVASVRHDAALSIGSMLGVDLGIRHAQDGACTLPSALATDNVWQDASRRLVSPNAAATDVLAVVSALAPHLAAALVLEELIELLLALLPALASADVASAAAVAALLNGLIAARGADLDMPHVQRIVQGMLGALERVDSPDVSTGTLHALRALAVHHCEPVLNALLQLPPPHSPPVVRAWQVLAKEPRVASTLLQRLAHVLCHNEPITAKPSPHPAVDVVCATAALAAIFQPGEMASLADLARSEFALVFATCLLRISSVYHTSGSEVLYRQHATLALRNFLTLVGNINLIDKITEHELWKRLEADHPVETIPTLLDALCRTMPDATSRVLDVLFEFLHATRAPHRLIATAVFAEAVAHRGAADPALLGQAVSCLTARLNDDVVKVYTQAIRGLGNVSACGAAAVDQYASSLIPSLLTACEHEADPIAMEALIALYKLVLAGSSNTMKPEVVKIALRIRSQLSRGNRHVRGAAFRVYDALCRHLAAPGEKDHTTDSFVDQLHSIACALIVHSADPAAVVSGVCRRVLATAMPWLAPGAGVDVSPLTASSAFDYASFLSVLVPALVKAAPARVPAYLAGMQSMLNGGGHQSYHITANAAMALGNLLRCLSSEQRKAMDSNAVCHRLLQLLQHENPDVRYTAAFVLGSMADL